MQEAKTSVSEHKAKLTRDARFLSEEFKIPLVAVRGKAPYGDDWGSLATCEPDEIEAHISNNGITGIGVVLGRQTNGKSLRLIDLEADTPAAQKTLEQAIRDYGVTTAAYTSGGKSPHYLFVYDGRLPGKAKIDVKGGLLDGVEVRLGGQDRAAQSVLPPSIHPDTGREYVWKDGCHPGQVGFAELPEDFITAICEAAGRKRSQNSTMDDSLAARFARGAKAPEGGRNDALFKYACRRETQLGDQLEREEVQREFRQDIHERNQRQCDPPLAEDEVESIINSALEYWEKNEQDAPQRPKTCNLTDMGNGERLVAKYGRSLRYSYAWGKWLVWDGRRWKIDDTGAVTRCCKNTVRAIHEEAARELDDNHRKAIAKWAQQSEKAERIQSMLKLAQSESGIPILPNELDNHPWKFNCQNGTIDLKTGKLLAHDRRDLITKVSPVVYNPEAKCPSWLSFLATVLDNDSELITYIRRLLGYSLTGVVSEHLLPILHGSGANGKSTFLNTVDAAFGPDYAMTAPPDLLMAKGATHPTERADLFGKRFVATVESEEGRRMAESLVKSLTGGDAVRARRMREDYWEFEPSHTIWMATNHKPQIRGNDKGIWRRLKLIPFTVSIPESQQDKRLQEKLLAELPGILTWMVQGCLDWQKHGLGEPLTVQSATNEYRNEQDVVGQFIRERCVAGEQLEAKASEIYREYKDWCDESGERSLNQTRFGSTLSERGYGTKRSRTGILRTNIALLKDCEA